MTKDFSCFKTIHVIDNKRFDCKTLTTKDSKISNEQRVDNKTRK